MWRGGGDGGGQGRKSSSHQPAHWGAELLVIDIWQLIIMAFFLTGHWSTLCRWEKMKEGRKGGGICHKEECYTDTHKQTHTNLYLCEDLTLISINFHSFVGPNLNCNHNTLNPKHNISNPNHNILTLTLNHIIPITYHNIPHTNPTSVHLFHLNLTQTKNLVLTTTYLQQQQPHTHWKLPFKSLWALAASTPWIKPLIRSMKSRKSQSYDTS